MVPFEYADLMEQANFELLYPHPRYADTERNSQSHSRSETNDIMIDYKEEKGGQLIMDAKH